MRLSAKSLDIDAFRSFLEAAGATFEPVNVPAAELLRFRIGLARGMISARKDGKLTISGEANRQLKKFQGHGPRAASAPPTPPARIITATIPAAEHQRARELLADAKTAVVFTDGSATSGGVGFGGWCAIIRAGFVNVELYGGAKTSTVNRMEIIAAIVALEVLPPGCAVKINTDSKYLRDGITKWIDGWKRNGWQTAARAPVKNEDLWRRLDTARDLHKVTWKWIPAHRGIAGNERADALAKQGRHDTQNATAQAAPSQQNSKREIENGRFS